MSSYKQGVCMTNYQVIKSSDGRWYVRRVRPWKPTNKRLRRLAREDAQVHRTLREYEWLSQTAHA